MAAWAREFKEFAFKSNLIDLAIAFILGTAFAVVIKSLVDNIFMPIVGAILSDESFAGLTFEFLGVEILYGQFITDVIYFLAVAWILFLIIKAVNQLRRQEQPGTKDCPYCITPIPIPATRCPSCTAELPAA
jgi:large conductance mechanosensitive channel